MSLAAHEAAPLVAFLMALRARGIRDLKLLKALESVPRGAFVPHQYADLAYKEIALPIPCGQTMPDPFHVAGMMEALALEPHHRVLEIGSGSGYTSAILGRLAGEVVALERFQTLVLATRARLAALDIKNVEALWADGLNVGLQPNHFDRIIVHARVEALSPHWGAALSAEGLILAGQGPLLKGFRRDGQGFREFTVCPARLQPLMPGLAQGL